MSLQSHKKPNNTIVLKNKEKELNIYMICKKSVTVRIIDPTATSSHDKRV